MKDTYRQRWFGTAPISFFTLGILFYLLWRIATLYPKWENTGTEATLSWDVFGYYLYLPAGIIYEDLASLSFIEEVFPTYRPAGDFHHAVDADSGNKVMKYPIGMAVLYLPFFLLAHVLAGWLGYPVDGFSLPYQMAISYGSLVYAFLGLILLRKVLLKFFADLPVALCLAVLALATNYLNYVSFDGAMPHNYLFTLYVGIIWLTIEWHEHPKAWYAFLLGICIGLATIVRPIELITLLIPLLWGGYDRGSFLQKWKVVWEKKGQVGLLILGMFLMGMIQMTYWKVYSGHWFFYSYGEFGFDWLSPHILDGLFSAKKGWLVYTPVMLFALLGFIPLYRFYRHIFWTILIFTLLTIYIVYSWEVWWYGGSFGSRAMIQSYALLSIPFTLMIQELLGMWSTGWKIAAFGSMLLCMDLNLIQTWQAHDSEGGWHAEGPTRKYYWKTFATTRPQKADKKFLDIRYEYNPGTDAQVQTLYAQDFESDTMIVRSSNHAFEGSYSLVMGPQQDFSPSFEKVLSSADLKGKPWLRVQARTLYTQMEWNVWQQCQFITEIWNGETLRHRYAIRIQRLANPWQWHDLHYELPLYRKAEPEDRLKVYFWNANGQKEVYIDNWGVSIIRP